MIKKFMLKKYREKKREELETKSAIIIQKHIRGRQVRQRSYFELLNLDSKPIFYILKEQKPLFMKFMRELGSIIESKFGYRYEDLYAMIKEDNTYDTIRVAEPDIFDYHWQPLI